MLLQRLQNTMTGSKHMLKIFAAIFTFQVTLIVELAQYRLPAVIKCHDLQMRTIANKTPAKVVFRHKSKRVAGLYFL